MRARGPEANYGDPNEPRFVVGYLPNPNQTERDPNTNLPCGSDTQTIYNGDMYDLITKQE